MYMFEDVSLLRLEFFTGDFYCFFEDHGIK